MSIYLANVGEKGRTWYEIYRTSSRSRFRGPADKCLVKLTLPEASQLFEHLISLMPEDEMKAILRKAGIYL